MVQLKTDEEGQYKTAQEAQVDADDIVQSMSDEEDPVHSVQHSMRPMTWLSDRQSLVHLVVRMTRLMTWLNRNSTIDLGHLDE